MLYPIVSSLNCIIIKKLNLNITLDAIIIRWISYAIFLRDLIKILRFFLLVIS